MLLLFLWVRERHIRKKMSAPYNKPTQLNFLSFSSLLTPKKFSTCFFFSRWEERLPYTQFFFSSHRHRIVFDSRARSMFFFRTFFFLPYILLSFSCLARFYVNVCDVGSLRCFLLQKRGAFFWGKSISLVKFFLFLLCEVLFLFVAIVDLQNVH